MTEPALPGIEPLGPPRVARHPEPPPAQIVAALAAFDVATVHESNYRRGLMTGLSALDSERSACGPAVTVLCHSGDNLMLHAAIDACLPGDVIVVSTLAPSEHGMFGELLATLCKARGIAALVTDAAVRDSRAIRSAGFPVWSRSVSAAGTTKQTAGWVNVPVVCGGTIVLPGDLVSADADGVVVVAASEAPAVVAASAEREEREAGIRARYAKGEGKDISELLTRAGVSVEG